MNALATMTLVDGVRVVVPDSIAFITPYVLVEQLDWFEDELPFLRKILEPGQQVIDIGANHGVYALSMANAVGPTGRVWAFEPSSSTADLLARSIETNGFAQAVLERCAISDHCGTAQLTLNGHSELNTLTRDPSLRAATEVVALSTLDECMRRNRWLAVDVVKIDAEGEESRILDGAGRFFAELSPLVQYEIRAGEAMNLDLVQRFAALGYGSYRLVPGLDLLVPFDASSELDPYLLNLFACKPDRARELATKGWLLEQAGAEALPVPAMDPLQGSRHDWRQPLAQLPYARQLQPHWLNEQAPARSGRAAVMRALNLRELSRDRRQAAATRYAALRESFNLLDAAREHGPSLTRKATFVRVARELGCRQRAVAALENLCNAILQGDPIDAAEPFLPAASRFDAVDPRGAFGNWLLCGAMEEYERLSSFSSFYADASSLHRLDLIASLGFPDAEMERRRGLLQTRFGADS